MNHQQVQAELEALRKELTETKAQVAATAVVQPNTTSRKLRVPTFIKRKLVVLATLAALAVGTYYTVQNLIYEKAITEQASFIEQIKDLSTLATSQAYVKAVIEKQDNELFGKEISANLPGTKRKLLLIVPGTVTAGVDFSQVNERNLQIDEENKKIELTLPAATIIQDPSLDFENVQTFSVEGIFRDEVNWDEAYELADEAEALVLKEAQQQGIYEKAETNATKTLTEFFKTLGYDTVITYER